MTSSQAIKSPHRPRANGPHQISRCSPAGSQGRIIRYTPLHMQYVAGTGPAITADTKQACCHRHPWFRMLSRQRLTVRFELWRVIPSRLRATGSSDSMPDRVSEAVVDVAHTQRYERVFRNTMDTA